MRPLIPALILLAFAPQDKAARKLEWNLPRGHAAEFIFLDRAGKPTGDQKLLIFSDELTPNSNRLVVDSYEALPLALVFQLPPEAMKTGVGWEHSSFHFMDAIDAAGGYDVLTNGGIRPVCAKGRYIAKIQKKGDEETAVIEGAFSIVEVRRDLVNNVMKNIVTKNELGTLATSVQFSLSKGMIQKAAWQYKVRAQDREGGRIVDKRGETHTLIEFKEDVELDAAKIQPALEMSVTRAVEWLKKQQKGGSWSNGKPGPTGGDATYLTSVAVRALIAAGVKPDDPVITQASRTLRSTPPQENFVLIQQLLALAAKTPAKDEADDAKRFAEELIRRRDPRTFGWAGISGRNDLAGSFLTALALEALATLPDVKGVDEPLRTGLDFFTGSWLEDDGRADLELELEKDATTIVPDPKKDKDVVPVNWPALVGKQSANDMRAIRKGSFFTVVAGLRMLLLLPERVKADEKLMKTVEGLLHRTLANLQYRWTLRTVPPVESYWCTQRMEYLGVLGPTLALAKIEKIGGCDWRLEGASLLMREQGDDGSWSSGTDQAVLKTAHALLFLASARR
jgi:hypothetical protein